VNPAPAVLPPAALLVGIPASTIAGGKLLLRVSDPRGFERAVVTSEEGEHDGG
jgi:hypothetical protein